VNDPLCGASGNSITSVNSTSWQTDADETAAYNRPPASPQPENDMLLLILIGAALSHARPEPPPESGLPTDPLSFHRERWRTSIGARSFW